MEFAVRGDTEIGRDKVLTGLIYLLGIALSILALYYAYAFFTSRQRYSNVFLGIGLALFYIKSIKDSISEEESISPESPSSQWGILRDQMGNYLAVNLPERFTIFDAKQLDNGLKFVLAVLAIVASVYVEFRWEYFQNSAQILGYNNLDYLVGTIVIVLVIDSTKRAYGWPIALVAIASIVYGLTGPYFPGILKHSGMDWLLVVREVTVGLGGVYGFILGIGATWIAIFIIFAGAAKSFGLLEFILNTSQEISGRFRTGVVHIAVISSLIIGSISGSAAANTATTGSFTIPMMKRQSVREDYGAAIESVASSGGQIMPPVMGVAAFLMADILGVPYVRVIQAGFLPALLFYASVALSVHLAVLKFGWTVSPSESSDLAVLKEGLHFVIPIGVLIYTLVILQYSPMTAGLYSTIALVGVMFVRNLLIDKINIQTIIDTTKDTLEGLKDGAVDMAPLVGVLGSMGIIVAMVTQTGLSQRLSATMLAFAGNILLLILLLAMITSILFGLGMPTPAAYILVVILVAPALIQAGVPELTAHMYVFYFAMLSSITPPVAIAVVIGARIADADFIQSATQALRLGAAGFIIPYGLVAHESLIYWSYPETIFSMVFLVAGLFYLSIGVIGFNGFEKVKVRFRLLFVGLTFVVIFGPNSARIFGLVAGAVLVILTHQKMMKSFTDVLG